MNRRQARELVLHMIFQQDFSGETAEALLGGYITQSGFADLAGECDLYCVMPGDRQEGYIRDAVAGAVSRRGELDGYIAQYAVGWNLGRISRMSKCVLRLCMLEIKYLGIPMKASVNEAIELTKRYDSEEAAQFVNGILASFVRAEGKGAQGEQAGAESLEADEGPRTEESQTAR